MAESHEIPFGRGLEEFEIFHEAHWVFHDESMLAAGWRRSSLFRRSTHFHGVDRVENPANREDFVGRRF